MKLDKNMENSRIEFDLTTDKKQQKNQTSNSKERSDSAKRNFKNSTDNKSLIVHLR